MSDNQTPAGSGDPVVNFKFHFYTTLKCWQSQYDTFTSDFRKDMKYKVSMLLFHVPKGVETMPTHTHTTPPVRSLIGVGGVQHA